MSFHGDIALGDTIDILFTTVQTTGAPFTLAGTPAVSAYVGNSTTQITAGITLTADFDGVTGLNLVRVVASAGNGYTAASNVSLVITTGTVNSVSVVGYVVGSFSIENRIANLSKTVVYPAGNFPAAGIVDSGTAQSVTGTTLVLRAAAGFADSELVGATAVIRSATTGAGQRRLITANTNVDDTVTVDAWTTTPTGTIVYDIYGSAPGSPTSPAPVNVKQVNDVDLTGDGTLGNEWGPA